MHIAVNCLEIEHTQKTDSGVMGTPSSRFAMPYPRSYTTTPFRLTARLHPGESGLSHCANSLSTLAATDSAVEGRTLAASCSLASAVETANEPIAAIMTRTETLITSSFTLPPCPGSGFES